MKIKQTTRKLRLLDFDIENQPWAYWYDGNTTSLPTAIAWAFDDEPPQHRGLRWSDKQSRARFMQALREMFVPFLEAYNQADIVTGHYIRKHDLPILSGLAFRLDLHMGPKLSHDTKLDMPKMSGVSLSQENLSYMKRMDEKKHHMNIPQWEDANLLSAEGFEDTRYRVISDVIQHQEIHRKLSPVLKPAKVWKP